MKTQEAKDLADELREAVTAEVAADKTLDSHQGAMLQTGAVLLAGVAVNLARIADAAESLSRAVDLGADGSAFIMTRPR